MSSKKETNKIVILVIVGLILAWLIGGFIGGFIGNIFFGIVMMAVIFSGVLGKKALERTGSIGVPLTIGLIFATNTWGNWWLYILGYLIAMFVGNALSNFRPNYKQEHLEYENELKYNLVSKEDNFTIKFPSKPRFIESIGLYQYNYKDSASFNISIADTDTPKTKKELWEELDSELKVRHNFADLDYEKTEIQGVPCINAMLHDENENIFYEVIFINGDKKYVVSLGINEQNDDLFNRFIGSFRFLSK